VVSDSQAKEHFLAEVLKINDPRGYPIIRGFQTNPEKKCQVTNFESEFCKNK
jgi:hypothetical protein